MKMSKHVGFHPVGFSLAFFSFSKLLFPNGTERNLLKARVPSPNSWSQSFSSILCLTSGAFKDGAFETNHFFEVTSHAP